MGRTVVGLNSPMAVKRYSGDLAVDAPRESYFGRKFMGSGKTPTKPIWRLTDLEKAAGEVIYFDLSMQMTMQPVEGSSILHGKEEALSFFTASVYIDQMRGGVNSGGAMDRKRTLHDLREVARARETEWWGPVWDQIFFIYLSGSRGANNDYLYPTTYSQFANNSVTAPDTNHLVYGGVATAKDNLQSTDTMTTLPIDRAVAYTDMMGGTAPAYSKVAKMQRSDIDGQKKWLCIMSPYQAFNMRRNTTTGEWGDIQKAVATAVGRDTEFYKDGLGEWNDTILHKHANVVTFSDYGAATNVSAARALFLGRQAGVVAFGSAGDGMRFGWHEETRDNGDQIVITSSCIWGFVKATFNGNDFGVMCIDTAAARP